MESDIDDDEEKFVFLGFLNLVWFCLFVD